MRQPDPAKAVKLLDLLLQFFGEDGEHWTRGTYDDGNGKRCLVGAMNYFQRTRGIAPADSAHYLRVVIWPCGMPRGTPPDDLIVFNDGRRNFKQLRTMIERARAMAQRHLDQPLPKSLPPAPPTDAARAAPTHAKRACTSAVIHAELALTDS